MDKHTAKLTMKERERSGIPESLIHESITPWISAKTVEPVKGRRKKKKKTPQLTYYHGPTKPEVQLEGTDDICTTLGNVPSRDRKGHSSYLWPGQLAKIQELEQTSCSKSANYTFASCYKELVLGTSEVVASNVQVKIPEYASSQSSFCLHCLLSPEKGRQL